MPKKEELIKKLYSMPPPNNFTVRDLEQLMKKCNCKKFEGGRGSSIKFVHCETNRVLTFDLPHPGKELYRYHIKMLKEFITDIEGSDEIE